MKKLSEKEKETIRIISSDAVAKSRFQVPGMKWSLEANITREYLGAISIPWYGKLLIKSFSSRIKRKYGVPPLTEEKIREICKGEDINLVLHDYSPGCYSYQNNGRKGMLLSTGKALRYNFGHELGHIVLNTNEDIFVDYFSRELNESDFFENISATTENHLLTIKQYSQEFSKNPHFIDTVVSQLSEQEVPTGIVRLVREDFHDVLHHHSPLTS